MLLINRLEGGTDRKRSSIKEKERKEIRLLIEITTRGERKILRTLCLSASLSPARSEKERRNTIDLCTGEQMGRNW